MGDEIKNEDIFDKKAFTKTQDDVKSLIKDLKILNEELVTVAKNNQEVLNNEEGKTLKSVKNINEAVEKLNKTQDISLEVNKQREKLEKRLATSTDENAKNNAELNVLIQEQNKLNKEQAKETLGLVDAYTKQSKRLNGLRKQYKSLVIEEGKVTKESKELLREIKKLDRELKDVDESAGQFQRSVGEYPTTMESATSAVEGFATAALSVGGILAGVKTSLEGTAQGAEELRVAQAKLEGGVAQAGNVASNAIVDFFNFAGALAEGDKQAVNLANNVALSLTGWGLLLDQTEDTGEFFNNTAAASENFSDKVLENAEALAALERRIIEFEKTTRPLEIRLAKINGEIDKQNALAGDSTRSFNQIEDAALKSQEAQEKRSSILISLAHEELSLIEERVRVANLAGGAGVDLLDQETAAIVKLQEARNDAATEKLETDKIIKETDRDRFERELDFAIDAFDAQKTVNERVIADETVTLERRRKLFDETAKLAEKSFQSQIKLVQDYTKQKIDLDSLAKESDEEVIRQKLKNFNFDDVTLGRILEIIKERKLANQDLADSNRDLNASEEEGIDIKKDIIAQEEALNKQSRENIDQSTKAIEDLEKDRFDNQKSSLERRIDLSKEGSLEELRLRQELNDLLLEEQDRLNSEQLKKEKEQIDNTKKLTEAAIQIIGELYQKGIEKRIEKLGEQIQATQQRADQLRESAESGQLKADESIAFEQKREAELEKQRERERKNAENAQAFFAVLSSFQANDGDLGKTITDVGVLRALANGLTAFDGVDDTGGRGNIDSKGGRLWTLHPNEQVYSKKDREALGFRTREEVKDIVKMYDNGTMNDLMMHDASNQFMNPSAFVLNGMNSKGMESKLDTLNKSIQNIKIPEGTVGYNSIREIIELKTKTGNRIKNIKRKLRG